MATEEKKVFSSGKESVVTTIPPPHPQPTLKYKTKQMFKQYMKKILVIGIILVIAGIILVAVGAHMYFTVITEEYEYGNKLASLGIVSLILGIILLIITCIKH